MVVADGDDRAVRCISRKELNPLRALLADDRGAIAVMAALIAPAALAACAFAIEVGNRMLAKQDLQTIADMAAVGAIRADVVAAAGTAQSLILAAMRSNACADARANGWSGSGACPDAAGTDGSDFTLDWPYQGDSATVRVSLTRPLTGGLSDLLLGGGAPSPSVAASASATVTITGSGAARTVGVALAR
jgi:Flp pilus assembly protein TadG